MDYGALLRKHNKKTISKKELENMFSAFSDEELYAIVKKLSDDSILRPVISSQTNGNRKYPVYMKYRISFENSSFENEYMEIEKLHPVLQTAGLLKSKPDIYRRYREQLLMLDRYLFSRNCCNVSVSRKERSFEIFGEEKVLDNRTFCVVLQKLGIDNNTLLFYDTPEFCFNDYIPVKKPKMTLLICENKDIWFNIRRMMFENHAMILFGIQLDGVVYGCGNKIAGKDALTAYTSFMGGSDISYFYWGDIDRAGLNIFLSAVRQNPSLSIQLFVPGYEEMLRLAKDRKIPDSADRRKVTDDYSSIFAAVDREFRNAFEENIRNNKRIPQEIISYAFLKNNMR